MEDALLRDKLVENKVSSVYAAVVVIYRLYFSPLARFPGPRLAAATGLYEAYFQIIKGGTFTWEINRLHQEYGPIIRIKPSELHIKDPDYYNVLYSGPGKHRNKDPWFSFITYPQSLFSTTGHDLHRARRKILGHFFKKGAIARVESVSQANTESLCRHFTKVSRDKTTLEVHGAFESFACDVLSQYTFGQHDGFHYLDEPTVSDVWKKQITSLFEFCRLVRYFPFLGRLARTVPAIAMRVCPTYQYVYNFERDVRQRVRAVIAKHEAGLAIDASPSSSTGRTHSLRATSAIYPAILSDPTVPQTEKDQSRLEDDALFLMMAGTDAPAQVLAITLFHIIHSPEVHKELKRELLSGIPNMQTMPSLHDLEKLPYLSAVIREGLRLSSVVTTRLPRSAPDEVLQYQQWWIPAGTFVSMSTYFILRDPDIFPEPTKFIPERWLLEPEELQSLNRYLVPASKGTMGCLGQNLQWSWMHIVLGTILRRFDLSLHETTEKNVEMTRDNFIGQSEQGMNLVQVKVLERYAV
ncbi:cytochrome P450 [Aspergillus californicus]